MSVLDALPDGITGIDTYMGGTSEITAGFLLAGERPALIETGPSKVAAAVAAVDQEATASVLILRPARFGAVATIAAGGETLPQKTTYFYPKPRDGLVLRPLDESP